MRTQELRDLHQKGNPFVLANAWDLGSAKLLEGMGAKAIGTSSAAFAFTLGLPDGGHITRDQAIAHAKAMQDAVQVPVSADLENGYADDPAGVAETVRLAAEAGIAGLSIEDTHPVEAYDFDLSVARIIAAAEVAKAHGIFLCARADGVMHGVYDLAEAIKRIQAFEAAGAECVYVPCVTDMHELKQVVDAVNVPVNALAVGDFRDYSIADFAQIGIARISLGSRLIRETQNVLMQTAKGIFGGGSLAPSFAPACSGEVDDLLTRNA